MTRSQWFKTETLTTPHEGHVEGLASHARQCTRERGKTDRAAFASKVGRGRCVSPSALSLLGGGHRIGGVSITSNDTFQVPEHLQEPFRSALRAAGEAWVEELGDRLVSLVLFGSVARGQARETSDIDLLVVAEGFPKSLSERRRPLIATWDRVRAHNALPHIEWNLVTKSPDEATYHSPLYLDITEDGLLLLDRGGLMAKVLSDMRERMRILGSRRVYLPDGSWYWDLKPDFRFGEVVEI